MQNNNSKCKINSFGFLAIIIFVFAFVKISNAQTTNQNIYSVNINNGAETTATASIILYLEAPKNAKKVRISESDDFMISYIYNIADRMPYDLLAEPGFKTVYAKFYDAIGRELGSASDRIILSEPVSPPAAEASRTTPEPQVKGLKIINTSWPDIRSQGAEKKARAVFKRIYKKEADTNKENERLKILIIAYDYEANWRNMIFEREALKKYAGAFGKLPNSDPDWRILRAIAHP
jgi:hypothetical protein